MFVLNEECGAPQCQKIVRQADLSLTLPWEGEGRLTLSGAKRETGWGDLSTRAPFETIDFHPTPPLISFASTLPLQGRVKKARELQIEFKQPKQFHTSARILAAQCVRGLPKTSALKTEGVGNAGRPMHPQPRVRYW